VGGGKINLASGTGAIVGGGENNIASSTGATVGGGQANTASDAHTTVGGGLANTATNDASTVSGGDFNIASGVTATVGGGNNNTASGALATVGGGEGNSAGGDFATVSGGGFNNASGDHAIAPGGANCQATGTASFAAGRRAQAVNEGAFVWADNNNFAISSTTSNEFTARATGGVRFVSAINNTGTPTAGVTLAAGGGAWASLSDVNAKANFADVDARALLMNLANIPVKTWNYKSQAESIRHIGPTAQDFKAAFGVGEDETRITTVDADGVALAAIQGLYQMLQERDTSIIELRQQIRTLQEQMQKLQLSSH